MVEVVGGAWKAVLVGACATCTAHAFHCVSLTNLWLEMEVSLKDAYILMTYGSKLKKDSILTILR